MSREPRGKRQQYSVDVVALTPRDDQLAVLLEHHNEGRDRAVRWCLPWTAPRSGESLSDTARRATDRGAGSTPVWSTQVGAFSDGAHPSASALSIVYVALVPMGHDASASEELRWFNLSDLPPLAERQAVMLHQSVNAVRDRLDLYPVAFRLLPATFTLSELQHMYELLLGRRLHKASFRRALAAAALVEPTDEWRSEGRGRPAQLYRFGPRKRRRSKRGVRFDLLG
ncbi:MAG: NUDIX domain-containing protein [Gemmatimonadota bacterium]|nr:NUDIX domain-containing protein [Gemmatimonadota bacterium]